MVQTFEINVAASVCPPLSAREIEEAIAKAMYAKESQEGMGQIIVEVTQTYGKVANLW
jgi:hypothetical protein